MERVTAKVFSWDIVSWDPWRRKKHLWAVAYMLGTGQDTKSQTSHWISVYMTCYHGKQSNHWPIYHNCRPDTEASEPINEVWRKSFAIQIPYHGHLEALFSCIAFFFSEKNCIVFKMSKDLPINQCPNMIFCSVTEFPNLHHCPSYLMKLAKSNLSSMCILELISNS